MRIAYAGSTHVGQRRTLNEDAFLLLPEEGLFCVADGMGGHASGEVAARIAVEEMAEFFRLTGHDADATWPFAEDRKLRYDENRLLAGMKVANLRIVERARADDRLKGMGTTLVCAAFAGEGRELVVGHVGDSRAYLLRQGALTQLTRDHSLLNDLLRTASLTPEEIEAFPHKNVIVRALRMREAVEVDLQRLPLQDGDLLLLCCDGLSTMVPDARLAELLRAGKRDLDRLAQALVDAANAAGGFDNVTCVLAQAVEA
jgi:serine/threonine protein phosphatase PrpC